MRTVSVVTMGCKVNQYDTAAILNKLPNTKYKRVPFSEKADVYIIDTCTVTHKADSEARNYINRAKRNNPDGVVIVTGCYAQVSSSDISKLKGVDYVVGNSHKFTALLKLIREGKLQKSPQVFISNLFAEKKRKFETPDIEYFPERTRAFLKIQDGCNYTCSFCIIPYARGRSRSLATDEVLNRINKLYKSGYREVVLTGIHLASYGRDLGTNLLDLLKEIEKGSKIRRIRLSSLDPADTTNDLIDFASNSETICPSFHIALQSGDETILKRMKRRYKPADFINCTDRIRNQIPDAGIGTDIMVGFPGESESEFKNSYELLADSALTYFHVFPYSKRKGTPASNMNEQVDPRLLKTRSKKLRDLGREKKITFYKKNIGRTYPVILETGNKAITPNYIAVKILNLGFNIGDEVEVLLNDVIDDTATGYAYLKENMS